MANNVEIINTEIDPSESPFAVLDFEKNGIAASVKVVLEFDGDWANLTDDKADTEDESRHLFAGELFERITRMF